MAGFLSQGPKLNMDDLSQRAALPLGSHLRTDAWDDKVYALNLKGDSILNPGDKMPLELTPVYFRLQRYQAPAVAPASANAPTPAQTTQPQGTAQTQPQTPATPDNNNAQPQQNPQ
jgi:hypothetical protein